VACVTLPAIDLPGCDGKAHSQAARFGGERRLATSFFIFAVGAPRLCDDKSAERAIDVFDLSPFEPRSPASWATARDAPQKNCDSSQSLLDLSRRTDVSTLPSNLLDCAALWVQAARLLTERHHGGLHL
jgi:hypothetical protein